MDSELRILGCSGGFGAGLRTTSFLWDADTLIDAGTGVGDLSLEELLKIDQIFLTHSHLDHIVSIPFLSRCRGCETQHTDYGLRIDQKRCRPFIRRFFTTTSGRISR